MSRPYGRSYGRASALYALSTRPGAPDLSAGPGPPEPQPCLYCTNTTTHPTQLCGACRNELYEEIDGGDW